MQDVMIVESKVVELYSLEKHRNGTQKYIFGGVRQ